MLISFKLGKELTVSTVKDLAVKITAEHYRELRKVQNTVNRKELVKQIEVLFINDLGIEKEELHRDSIVV